MFSLHCWTLLLDRWSYTVSLGQAPEYLCIFLWPTASLRGKERFLFQQASSLKVRLLFLFLLVLFYVFELNFRDKSQFFEKLRNITYSQITNEITSLL